jgi:uncharacterized protein (DUF1684 family)
MMSELSDFRAEKDDFFAHHPQSPLTSEQKRGFTGLPYYPENEALRLEVKVERLGDQKPIQMQTSTGGVQTYMRYGRFQFQSEGQLAELTIYEGENGFFLPFADSLAGEETYPAGRYLEPESLPGDRFLVDFNLAYNPNCAYNEMWSCPITPAENRLQVPVRAGEKLFETTSH